MNMQGKCGRQLKRSTISDIATETGLGEGEADLEGTTCRNSAAGKVQPAGQKTCSTVSNRCWQPLQQGFGQCETASLDSCLQAAAECAKQQRNPGVLT
jgi:hypothetical protein